MSAAVRVLVVDDHPVVRGGLVHLLRTLPGLEVVGEAADGLEAVRAAADLHPDVVLMDVQMPVLDGIEATRRIVAEDLGRVVILTTFDRDDYLFQALSAGASGFLLKNAGPEELVAAVRAAAGGDALLAPEVTKRVIERFVAPATPPAGSAADAPTTQIVVDLTERESEVLHLLAQALSNAEIAARLYIGEATVKTHVSNVLQKVGARDRVAAVVYAHRHGLA